MMKKWLLVIVILFAFSASGYFVAANNHLPQKQLNKIRIGVLPDENAEALNQRYKDLITYISQTIDRPVELVIPENYQDLVRLFEENKIELANFGGLTYLHVHKETQAQTIVMRDVDAQFSSYFITQLHTQPQQLSDYYGKHFSFGSKLSTSGHLMPRFFLQEQGIKAESFFKNVHYSMAHDETIYSIAEGKFDIAAVNSEVFNQMKKDGRIKSGTINILWQTPPYVDYVWAVQNNMPEDIKLKLRDAFLSLTINKPEHAKILTRLGADYFLPAGDSEFQKLRDIAVSQGLL